MRSDLYSLGAVLYELLAQRPPFQADGLPALLREIAESEPDSLRKTGVPLDLATIAHTCLAKLPARRYGSASALVADLRAWLEDRPISARPVTDLEKLWRAVRRHPALSLLSVLLVAAVVIGMLLQYRANLSLQQTTHQSLTAQVHAIRKSGQWELRNAGLEVARQAAAFENELDLRNDVITLLATPGCRELDRHSFLQPVSTPISPNGQNYAEVRDQQLWIKAFDAATPAVEISPPNSSSVFQEALFFSEDGGALMVVFKDLSSHASHIDE